MATFKHISSKNADYGAAEAYLTFEHDEFTMKPTLDENGRLIPREDYRISSLNCEGEDFAVACMRANLRYEGNGNQLFVFEAPIDLLSFICLYPQDWQTRNYLALGGVSGKALDRFLSERKDTRKVFLCLDSDTAGSEACSRLAQDIPSETAVIRLVPARKDWNDVLRQQGDIPSRKFIAETITLRELPTAQPVPMLRMADVELTSVDWLWFPYIPLATEMSYSSESLLLSHSYSSSHPDIRC